MAIVYRLEKGAPLSAEEIDGNFRELEWKNHPLRVTSTRSYKKKIA